MRVLLLVPLLVLTLSPLRVDAKGPHTEESDEELRKIEEERKSRPLIFAAGEVRTHVVDWREREGRAARFYPHINQRLIHPRY